MKSADKIVAVNDSKGITYYAFNFDSQMYCAYFMDSVNFYSFHSGWLPINDEARRILKQHEVNAEIKSLLK